MFGIGQKRTNLNSSAHIGKYDLHLLQYLMFNYCSKFMGQRQHTLFSASCPDRGSGLKTFVPISMQ